MTGFLMVLALAGSFGIFLKSTVLSAQRVRRMRRRVRPAWRRLDARLRRTPAIPPHPGTRVASTNVTNLIRRLPNPSLSGVVQEDDDRSA